MRILPCVIFSSVAFCPSQARTRMPSLNRIILINTDFLRIAEFVVDARTNI
jgi:hypothetical protein